ncbi:MAG: YbaB/EbfC family nucleoid-associated protein [Clostridia bacterium]|nr:YbaB/EbfC family nucleoid-associated protein [Clostridia bacterium]
MSKFNGFGGGFPGGGNMNQLLKQAQKMQNDMMKSQEEIEAKEFEVSSGGGAVTIVMNGKKLIKSIKIKPEVVDPDDVETLEDLILAAITEGNKKADSIVEQEMGKYNVPGGLNGLF